MLSKPAVSLCIPTNGVIEWVFPVLDSIYKQNVDNDMFEVIVTDNGNNEKFSEEMEIYLKKYSNILYRKTNAVMFLNQIESFKLANGELIKFVNHRTKLLPGSLQYLVDFALKNVQNKPVVYFSNGFLEGTNNVREVKGFDSFVSELSYWSSWSGGLAVWKKHFDEIPLNVEFNSLFPHTTVLFFEKDSNCYTIDNTLLLEEIPASHGKKGNYDLFFAFAVEFLGIIEDLLRQKQISLETFLKIKRENKRFIVDLYLDFVVEKKQCSYEITNYKNSISVYYTMAQIKLLSYYRLCKRLVGGIIYRKGKK